MSYNVFSIEVSAICFWTLEPLYKYYEQIQSSGYQQQYSKKSSHFKVKENKETQTPDITELVPHPLSTKNLELVSHSSWWPNIFMGPEI